MQSETATTIQTPLKTFISYSWSTPGHQEWVINLARRLVDDGVQVVIDKWDLKEGHDLYSFMESMVTAPDIDKVLIVLDKKYVEKADGRKGGVGTETQIVSSHVYSQVKQEKFIPVVREADENGRAYLPAYLQSRLYIDFTNEDKFEESYEQLLRNIYDRPVTSRPKLGKAPSYLFDDSPVTYRTTSILRGLDATLFNHPARINAIIRDFNEEFLINMPEFKLTFPEANWLVIGKQIIENLTQYTPLRNDFIGFWNKVFKSGVDFDIDLLVNFFEKMYVFTEHDGSSGSHYDFQYDNYKFMIHELFLYVAALLLKHDRYDLLEHMLLTVYFVEERYRSYKKEGHNFDIFRKYINSIDEHYNQLHSTRFYTPMGSFMVTRMPEGITREALIEADIICFHIGGWHDIDWLPILYILKHDGDAIDFFKRFVSKRHFEKVKGLFSVSNPAEFIDRLKKMAVEKKDESYFRYDGSGRSIIPIFKLIDADKVATAR